MWVARPGRSRRRFADDAAQSEVGLAWVLLAVLVSAAAAGYYVTTHSAFATGYVALHSESLFDRGARDVEAEPPILVLSVQGERSSRDVGIEALRLEVTTDEEPVDLSSLVVRYSNGSAVEVYTHGGDRSFFVTLAGDDGSADLVLEAGETAVLRIPLPAPLAPREGFTLRIFTYSSDHALVAQGTTPLALGKSHAVPIPIVA